MRNAKKNRKKCRACRLDGDVLRHGDLIVDVLRYALGHGEPLRKAMEDVMESVRKSLGVMGWSKQQLKTLDGKAMSENIRSEDTVHPTVAKIRQRCRNTYLVGRITQKQNEIRLVDNRLFKPASETPSGGVWHFGHLGDFGTRDEPQIRVEGHTDDSEWARNWRLSAGRSIAVVEVLQKGPIW